MAQRLASFLSGLSFGDRYALAGACVGTSFADFGFSVMLRVPASSGSIPASTTNFVAGNIQAPAAPTTKGYALLVVAGPQPTCELRVIWADGAGVQQTLSKQVTEVPLSERALLVHVFFVRDPGTGAVTALLFVNGTVMQTAVAAGFRPADSGNPLAIGGGSINGSQLDCLDCEISGFAFVPSLTSTSYADKLLEVQELVDAQVTASLQTLDLASGVGFDPVFSVRRGLPRVAQTWLANPPSALKLVRTGDDGMLAVGAADPLFSSSGWSAGGGPGAVTSVFGRVGAVVAVLGDYAASLVTNDSGVAGATVKAALDALAAAIAAIPPAPVTSVFGRVGAVVGALGDYAGSLVTNDSGVAGATVTDALNALAGAIATALGMFANYLPLLGGTMTGAIRVTPTPVPLAATTHFDVAANDSFTLGVLTADVDFVFDNPAAGRQGWIGIVQDGAGGHKITSIAAAGFTLIMLQGTDTTINGTSFLVAGARSLLYYSMVSLNGVDICFVSLHGGAAAAFT